MITLKEIEDFIAEFNEFELQNSDRIVLKEDALRFLENLSILVCNKI